MRRQSIEGVSQVVTVKQPTKETIKENAKSANLPVVVVGDGFQDTDDGGERLIRGVILKCVDGDWSDREGTVYPIGTPMIVFGVASALQCWRDQNVTETIVKLPGQPLPDLDDLNGSIPKSEWEEGLDGNPRPPWQHVYVIYLLNPKDGGVVTLINSTIGMRICYDRIKDKVKYMCALRGEAVCPLVQLDTKAMKTAYGVKKRPELTIIEWRDLSPQNAPALERAPAKQIGKPVLAATLAEEMGDEIPFTDSPDLAPSKRDR
jgi:hypothetical protein